MFPKHERKQTEMIEKTYNAPPSGQFSMQHVCERRAPNHHLCGAIVPSPGQSSPVRGRLPPVRGRLPTRLSFLHVPKPKNNHEIQIKSNQSKFLHERNSMIRFEIRFRGASRHFDVKLQFRAPFKMDHSKDRYVLYSTVQHSTAQHYPVLQFLELTIKYWLLFLLYIYCTVPYI